MFREAAFRRLCLVTPVTMTEPQRWRICVHLRVNVLFAADLFNEGLDIPRSTRRSCLLRPTGVRRWVSQQLGWPAPLLGKAVLTALDFIGQQRREFR